MTEDALQAMLEGREDLSEVQDNPFAEMMKEDDAAEAAMSGAPAEAAPVETAPAESAPAEEAPAAVAEPAAVEEPAEEPAAETSPADTSKMSDEEFEAFMKKAQAFYDTQANDSGNSEVSDDAESSDDDEDFPSLEVHSGDD